MKPCIGGPAPEQLALPCSSHGFNDATALLDQARLDGVDAIGRNIAARNPCFAIVGGSLDVDLPATQLRTRWTEYGAIGQLDGLVLDRPQDAQRKPSWRRPAGAVISGSHLHAPPVLRIRAHFVEKHQ